MSELFEKLRGSSKLLIDRDIKLKKQEFGVVLYDQVNAIFEKDKQTFLSSQNDLLVVTVRPALLKAQREVVSLESKRTKRRHDMEEKTAAAEEQEAPSKSTKWRGKLQRAASKTRLFSLEQQIHHFKGNFGLELFDKFVELETTQNWVPADPLIRSAYEECRKAVVQLEAKKKAKRGSEGDNNDSSVRRFNTNY